MCGRYRGKKMTSGVFSNINSSTNLLAGRQNAGYNGVQKNSYQQPVSTTPVQIEEEPDKKTKVLNAVKKAAPIAAPIAAVPLSAILAYHLGKKGVSELTKSVSELTNKNIALQEQINMLSANFNSDTIKEEVKKTALSETKNSIDAMKNTMFGLGAAVAGLAGINIADKLKEEKGEEKLEKEIKTGIETKQREISDLKTVATNASRTANSAKYHNDYGILSKYHHYYNGINLLQNENTQINKIKAKDIKSIQEKAPKYLKGEVQLNEINSEYLVKKYYPEFAPLIPSKDDKKEGKSKEVDWKQIGTHFLGFDESKVENMEESVKNSLRKRGILTIKSGLNLDKIVKYKKLKPSVWSVTSELDPIKEGGLGKVPHEVAINATKAGVDMPTFTPMYTSPGKSEFVTEDGVSRYTYNGNTYKNLIKIASYDVDVYRGGKNGTEKVEFYTADDPLGQNAGNKIILVKNDNYFGTKIYERNQKVEEPEKFAFFSKAVYDFAKIKLADENNDKYKPVRNLEIADRSAFDEIKTPDAMILNDWQAAPFAALARYKAPLEAGYSNNISSNVAEKLENMNIVAIGHNLTYQGKACDNMNAGGQQQELSSSMLNTLFDEYAAVIATNAESGAFASNVHDPGLKAIDNVLIMNPESNTDNYTNLLSMGVHLSNYFCPVSQNYANELIGDKPAQKSLSGYLQWALNQRSEKVAKNQNQKNTLVGVINGNDYDKVNLVANGEDTVKSDGTIKKSGIKNLMGLQMQTYDCNTPIDDVMERRFENKKLFYNDYLVPLSNMNDANIANEPDCAKKLRGVIKDSDKDFKHLVVNDIGLKTLSDEELKKTPIISMVGRLATQKGTDLYITAINNVFKNWNNDPYFSNKQKPIFVIAGGDQENGQQIKLIENLKKGMNADDSSRIIVGEGFACTPGYAAGADFFSVPSRFEPCGLTQGESLGVGTPVIASQVGGLVDTLNRSVTEDGQTRKRSNGILTDTNFTTLNTNLNNGKPENQNDYDTAVVSLEGAIKNALKVFYDDVDKTGAYKNMVKDSVTENFDWAQHGKTGPLYDYLKMLGINGNLLNDVESKIKAPEKKVEAETADTVVPDETAVQDAEVIAEEIKEENKEEAKN